MASLQDLLNDSHIVNAATVVLLIASGLYAYTGLLGGRGGVLRQLIVSAFGCAAGIVVIEVIDQQSEHYFSGLLYPAAITVYPSMRAFSATDFLIGYEVVVEAIPKQQTENEPAL